MIVIGPYLQVGWNACSLVLCLKRHVSFQSIQLAHQVVFVNIVRHAIILSQNILYVVVHILRTRRSWQFCLQGLDA